MASDSPVYFDSHMHTPLCKHAAGEPEEYATVGQERGLRGIIVTCHSPMPNGFSAAVRMRPEEFPDYVSLVGRARQAMEDSIEVRLGLESDWFPGMEGWLRDLHASADFHYILGSVHYHIPEYRNQFLINDDIDAFVRGYFVHLAEAAESGLFDSLSHPDLVKNALAANWNFNEYSQLVSKVLDRIAATGIAMELNTSGVLKSCPEMNPGPGMLRMMCERGIPVVLGSDSHQPHRVGADFEEALENLKNAGYEKVSHFEKRSRVDTPIDRVLDSLKPIRHSWF